MQGNGGRDPFNQGHTRHIHEGKNSGDNRWLSRHHHGSCERLKFGSHVSVECSRGSPTNPQ